jgi:hypothetical protein
MALSLLARRVYLEYNSALMENAMAAPMAWTALNKTSMARLVETTRQGAQGEYR